MKKIVIYSLFLFLSTFVSKQLQAEKNAVVTPLPLTSKLLAFADGKSYGVTKEHIGFTLQIIRELTKMIDGEKNADGNLVGVFMFDDKHCTMHELHELELFYEQELLTMRNQGLTTTAAYTACIKKQALLQAYLLEARTYFNAKVLPFTQHADGMKDLTFALIEESCAKRNNNSSFLLTWGKCEEGKEAELIDKELTSFKTLDTFIVDLVHFLKDFVQSCPQARKQFIAMIKARSQENGAHGEPHK